LSGEKPAAQDVAAGTLDRETRRLIIVLGVGGFASSFSMRILDPAVPTMAVQLQRSIDDIALLATGSSLAYAFGQPVLGSLGDAFGKARLVSICAAILGLTSVLCALAPSYESLVAARLLAGIAAGGIIPLAMASIGDRVVMADRQVAIARFLIATISGQIAGAALSGLLQASIGWRGVFLLAAGLALAASFAAFGMLWRGERGDSRRLDPGAMVRRYGDVLRNPHAPRLCAVVAVEGGLVYGLFPFLAALLEERTGAGPREAGIAIACFGVGGLLYGALVSWIVRSLGPARMVVVGGLAMASALLLLGVARHWSARFPAMLLHGFGFNMLHNTLQTQATSLSETARGSAVALFAFSLFAGSALGPIGISPLLREAGVFGALSMLALALASLGCASPRFLGLNSPAPHRPR